MEETATQMVKFLRDRGVFVTAVAYPVIPKGFLMFRMIPTASHSDEDVIQTLDIFKQMRLETKLTVGMNKEQEAKINKLYGI